MNRTYKGTDSIQDAEKIFKKHAKKLRASEKHHLVDEDYPFENFGLGITSYFKLITALAKVFTFISIFCAAPMIVLFSTEKGYTQYDKGLLIKQMIGNLGEAT
jgi:hypothetical protein